MQHIRINSKWRDPEKSVDAFCTRKCHRNKLNLIWSKLILLLIIALRMVTTTDFERNLITFGVNSLSPNRTVSLVNLLAPHPLEITDNRTRYKRSLKKLPPPWQRHSRQTTKTYESAGSTITVRSSNSLTLKCYFNNCNNSIIFFQSIELKHRFIRIFDYRK